MVHQVLVVTKSFTQISSTLLLLFDISEGEINVKELFEKYTH